MLFARAIGDDNPAYRDPESAAAAELGGLIAPPTFTQAAAQFDPDSHLRPKPTEKWHGSASGPGFLPVGRGGLHAEQQFTYHRTVRVGDVLRTEARMGQSWEKRGRSGRLVFTERFTDFYDEGGALVVTARSVSVQKESVTGGEG
jgi:acyl dehydratase